MITRLASHDNSKSLGEGIGILVFAGFFLSFFVLSAYSSLADKFLLLTIFNMVLVRVIGEKKVNVGDAALIFVILGYFCFALICAALTAEYFGLHSFTGLYELWRAHISLILGLILAGFISQNQKYQIFSGLMLALKLNIVFTLLQAISGPYLVELMLQFSQFEGEGVEYRSGIIRTVGFFTNANTNAWFVSLYLYHLMSQSQLKKFWVIFSLCALLSTGSRTVLFVSLLIITFQYLNNNGNSLLRLFRKNLIYVFLTLSAIWGLESLNENSTSLGYSLIPDVSVITSIDEEKGVANSYFRAFALKTSMERFFESPIVGWGPGNYGTPSSFRSKSSYLSEDGYDFFIEKGMTQLDLLIPLLLPETGIVGFVFWIVSMFYILRVLKFRAFISPLTATVYYWCLLLLVNSFVGPGITHPLIVAILPIIVSSSIRNRAQFGHLGKTCKTSAAAA